MQERKKVQATKFTLQVPHRMKEITNRRPKNGPAVPQYTSSIDSRTKNGKMDKNKCFNLKNSLFFYSIDLTPFFQSEIYPYFLIFLNNAHYPPNPKPNFIWALNLISV